MNKAAGEAWTEARNTLDVPQGKGGLRAIIEREVRSCAIRGPIVLRFELYGDTKTHIWRAGRAHWFAVILTQFSTQRTSVLRVFAGDLAVPAVVYVVESYGYAAGVKVAL